MSFIEMPGLDEAHEPVIAPEGRYPLVVESATSKHNKENGKDNILVVMGIDEGEYANVLHNLSLPGQDDEQDSVTFKLLQIKRFCIQFGISVDGGINTEEFAGSRAEGNLAVGEWNNNKKNELQLDPIPEGE